MTTTPIPADFFASRHLGPGPEEQATMLAALGFESLDALVTEAMPAGILMDGVLNLPAPLREDVLGAKLGDLAARNNPGRAMIGLGYYGTVTPAVIRRCVLEDPTWYTAYTPYQPEISQGRLEALLNFQTMVAELTGLSLAGSSLLDEATAVAEAVALARRANRSGECALVDAQLLPQSLGVLRTRARSLGIEVVVADGPLIDSPDLERAFAVVVQTPERDGRLQSHDELAELAERAHAAGAHVIAAADLLALTLVTAPGEWGADIAVGTTQRFGVPLFYGGPHAGYIAVRDGLERQLPGRLVGVSVDADGTPALRLALQTREQHIRREKATSNICTAQVLLAVMASMYAVYHGPQGLKRIAGRIHTQTRTLAGCLVKANLRPVETSFFDTLTIAAPGRAVDLVAAARAAGIQLRSIDDDHFGMSLGEDATEDDLKDLCAALDATWEAGEDWGDLAGHQRSTSFCEEPVFTSHHSETRMMRYLHTLAGRDFALDQGMIPLGSCTMKLNSAAELEPITLPGFANLHPFVPAEDAQGTLQMINTLQEWLCEITGYDAVTVQPNAGSQGEFAGLTVIRRYHESRGDDHRRVCLIPSSAHGTNAASAAMAGMTVVVVKAAADGSVDMDDLRAKIAKHADELAAIMVTYPSTHGVFEETITELCDLVHAAGGQVYVDGANMNALVGLARPGKFGSDVSHLNLHKTFAIPHGGGGPGVGPIGVRAHLVEFLPGNPVTNPKPDTISATEYGSVGVLPISYAYLAMMGPQGLKKATEVAILNANYIAHRLKQYYPILYVGQSDLVAHECILDLRPLTARTKISVDDVAKRLVDYGFHAPTMSFPVAGTLMVEPTESEDLVELDRFCDAMIAIHGEAEKVASGEWDLADNPLVNAPHTIARVTAEDWTHPYSRTQAAFPEGRRAGLVQGGIGDKYWPAVARIDGAYGDRNLVCACPPMEAYGD